MITRVFNCKICGAEVVREFPTEQKAKFCHYADCDSCKAKNYELNKQRSSEKRRIKRNFAKTFSGICYKAKGRRGRARWVKP